MIRIKIPQNNIPEREYIIDVLFTEFLGIEYIIEYHLEDYYLITFNNKKLIIKDFFFNILGENKYLDISNLPTKINHLKNSYTGNKSLPVIYGTDFLEIDDTTIISHQDIFASSFFMLTRWEEFVNPIRDKYERFPGVESVAYKFQFIDFPVVNEYANYLWLLIKKNGYEGNIKSRRFRIIPTCDVDHLFLYTDLTALKYVVRQYLKKRSFTKACKEVILYSKTKIDYNHDPYFSFLKMMETAEKYDNQYNFFFLMGKNTEFDNKFLLEGEVFSNLLAEINQRGHIVGFHPGFDTYNNPILWNELKQKFDSYVGKVTVRGRQHFLRFDNPITWRIWDDNNMNWDSTLLYPDVIGFRSGSCYNYTTFDIIKRKKLKLQEYPLIIMDAALKWYLRMSQEKAIEEVKRIKNIVRNYNGDFVFLWHNSGFFYPDWVTPEKVHETLFQ